MTIVVAGNAAGPYVDAAAHPGVTQIGQVVRLAAGADFAALDLDEITDVHVVMQNRLGPNSREGTDPAVLGHARAVDDTIGEDLRVGSDLGVADDAIGPNFHTPAQPHAADQDRIDIDEHVAPDLDVAANVDARGIRQRRAGEHQLVRPFAPVQSLDLRKLDLVVDAHDFRGVRAPYRLDSISRQHRSRHHIGQVVLALGVVPAQSQQPFAQASRGRGHESRVDFAYLQLLRGRILLLDDGGDVPGGIADDAPVTRRVVNIHGQEAQGACVGRRNQFRQGCHADQRHVAVEHQHRMVVGNHAHGLHDSVAGAQLIRLQYPLDVFVGERRLYLHAAMPIDHVDVGRAEIACGADHVLQQRPPCQWLQHFRQVGIHPLALTRSEYDDGKLHDSSAYRRS